MSDREKVRALIEKEFWRRGLEPAELRSDNPDPVAREAEENRLWDKFISETRDELFKNLGRDRGDEQ